MRVSTLELIILVFYTMLTSAFLCSNGGVQMLIISELCWISCYSIAAVSGSILSDIALLSALIPALLLAAAECGIWILILVYSSKVSKISSNAGNITAIKFILRARRLLKSNRFII